ncbi:MAG: serine/threonine-protein kinase [Polyangiales bacterium]
MPHLTASDRIGTTVGGRYEVKRLLGEGGFSSVFEAIHNITGRSVALKLLHPHLVTTEQITERFLLEARAMARIRHDGIVQVLDAGKDDDDTVYIALELLEGEALETTLQRSHSISWGEAVAIGIDVLHALAEAHKNKIVHRDIKPGNIFVTRKPTGGTQAKLLDFGIAHVAQAKGKFTQQGVILGTPEYMSPEQARAGQVGPEADLWSVGVVLFECVVGETPFMSENTTEILVKVQTERAPELCSVIPSVPRAVSDVVHKALERDVANRYHSADEMRLALERAIANADQERIGVGRSVLRGPTGRRAPAPTMADPTTEEAPRVEVVRVGSSVGAAALSPSPPTRPTPKRTEPKRAAEPRMTPGEGVQVIRPGRLVVEEVVSSTRYDEGSGRPVRRVNKPATPPAESPAAPPPAPADEFVLDRDRFSLDQVEAPSSKSRPDVFDPPPLEPTRSAKDSAPDSSGTFSSRLSSPDTPVTFSSRLSSPETPSSFSSNRRADSGRSTAETFNAPPAPQRSGLLLGGGVAALVVVGLIASAVLRPTPPPTTPSRPSPDVVTAPADAGGEATPVVPRLRLQEIHAIATPTGGDSSEFARHAAVSRGDSVTTQRVIASCVRGAEGQATLYFHPLIRGDALGSTRAPMACAGFDLGVVSDVTGDGTDDVVAVAAEHNALLLFNSASRQVARSIAVTGVRGVAVGGGLRVGGESLAVVYTEPGGDEQPGTVVAVSLRTGQTRWRQSGSGNLGRFGQPVELGLAVGPDVNRDGVSDVVVGLGSIIAHVGAASAQRCVQVLSGATGEPLWSPRCRGRGRGSQSVSLGPDVNGDGVPDVAVGTDRPDRGEPAVELRSGTDGTEIRSVSLPASESAAGFGWPVALVGAASRGGAPIVVVGSVAGSRSGLFLFDSARGTLEGRTDLPGVGAATLRIFGVAGNTPSAPWSLVVGTPSDGIKALAIVPPREDES